MVILLVHYLYINGSDIQSHTGVFGDWDLFGKYLLEVIGHTGVIDLQMIQDTLQKKGKWSYEDPTKAHQISVKTEALGNPFKISMNSFLQS